MNINLTPSAIYTILQRKWHINDLEPVLQVIDIRNVYRIVLSDGSFHLPLMLHAKLNDLIESQQLKKGSIIQLNKCRRVRLSSRICVIVMDLDVIQSECDIIGNPKPYFPLDQAPVSLRPKRLVLVKKCGCKSEKRKGKSMEVEQLMSRIARMTVERNKQDDDMNACIEKLEKLGRETKKVCR